MCQALRKRVEWRFNISNKERDENGNLVVIGVKFDPHMDRLEECPLVAIDIETGKVIK